MVTVLINGGSCAYWLDRLGLRAEPAGSPLDGNKEADTSCEDGGASNGGAALKGAEYLPLKSPFYPDSSCAIPEEAAVTAAVTGGYGYSRAAEGEGGYPGAAGLWVPGAGAAGTGQVELASLQGSGPASRNGSLPGAALGGSGGGGGAWAPDRVGPPADLALPLRATPGAGAAPGEQAGGLHAHRPGMLDTGLGNSSFGGRDPGSTAMSRINSGALPPPPTPSYGGAESSSAGPSGAATPKPPITIKNPHVPKALHPVLVPLKGALVAMRDFNRWVCVSFLFREDKNRSRACMLACLCLWMEV